MQTPHNKLITIARDILDRLSEELELPAGRRYYVVVRTDSNLRINKKKWLKALRDQVNMMVSSEHEWEYFEIQVQHGATFRFRALSCGDRTFSLMMLSDSYVGGAVTGSYVRSINRAVGTKTSQLATYRSLFPQCWLLLVDHIQLLHSASSEDEVDIDMVRQELTRPQDWDRVLVVNPRDLTTLLDF